MELGHYDLMKSTCEIKIKKNQMIDEINKRTKRQIKSKRKLRLKYYETRLTVEKPKVEEEIESVNQNQEIRTRLTSTRWK